MKSENNILSGPPVQKKWAYKSVAEYFLEKIEKNGSTPALISIETGEQLTHSQILAKSQKLSISLKKLGLKLNDRIGICSENNLNFAIAVFSSIFLGTTICPFNPIYTESELIHTMTISRPKYIFVSMYCLPKLQKILRNLPWSPKLILLYAEASNPEIPNIPDLISRISDSELRNFKLPEIDPENHVLLIACSSGTTGLPKGVMLTDKNVFAQLRHYNETEDFMNRNTSTLGMLPLFHAYGIFILFFVMSFGAKLIVFSKFDERIFLQAVEKYRVDSLNLVPPLMVFLAKSPMVDNYDLSCVKRMACGAAPLSKEIEEAVKKRFNIPFIRNGYGMTETTLSVITTPEIQKVSSVGTLLRGVKAKVVPLEGNSGGNLGPNCEGELCFKGDIVMKGYCENEEATKAMIDEDGFLHTGDVGYYDEDGYGKEYVSTSKKLVSERHFVPVQNCCKQKCFLKISTFAQSKFHDQFWNLGDYNKQNFFLSALMKCKNPLRVNATEVPCLILWTYYFSTDQKNVAACKQFLSKILNMGKGRLECVQKKILARESLDNKRDKHEHQCVKLTDDVKELIKVHCLSMPHHQSHYSRESTSLNYIINPEINLHKMYEEFLEFYVTTTGSELAFHENTYSNFFNHYINFSFKLPRTDVCNAFYLSSLQAIQSAGIANHKKNVQEYQALKKELLSEENVLCREFDYAQNLPLPKIPVSEQFYKILLWLYLFNVHVFTSKNSYMFPFLEGSAKKGANTVCSFIQHVIEKEFDDRRFTKIVLFSDASGEQNRNYTVFAFFLTLCIDLNIEIWHIFPVRCHSYYQCDRNFGLYSQKKKKLEQIETAAKYIELIRDSRDPPFIMVESANNILHDFEKSFKGNVKIPKAMKISQTCADNGVESEGASDGVRDTSMETGEQYTFSQVLEKSIKLTISLEKLGLKLNDRVAICSENSFNYGIAILSSIFLGTAFCPLNPAYTERELIYGMSITRPKYVFASILCLPIMQKVLKDIPWSINLILLYPDASCSEVLNLPDLISRISDLEMKNFKLPEIDINDHVLIIAYSSGTTGLPKGVMLTDKNVLSTIQNQDQDPARVVQFDSTVLGMLPMYHVYGLFVFFSAMAFNANLIILSKFNERLFLKAVEKYRIESLTLVPPLMVFLAKSPIVGEYDLSCVKRIICGAAPLSQEIAETVMKRLKLPFICSGYGMSELTITVINTAQNHKINSIGVLQPDVIAKVIPLDGESKEPLGPNCEGELCFKGDLVMKGYCENEEATKSTIDEDGFLHTGDVGYYDEDEYFFIVDRVKELIKYKGFQVPPAELEAILLTHPKIRDAAVLGLPDETAGELPLAFVVKQPGVEITAEEIIKYVNDQVSAQKRLRGGVRFIEAIPKTPSGKILRRDLRQIL
ncbi:uncharacterized protein LOC117173797 [Belonocnema kinseyi]|uniref:uncharacterized protein LOC117173797 n=1 Tax=Belonocnema kinseyi TaxID=2817044 RepID=UPI00143DCAC2|nr:uncharacterized protein LOC117173797 [Belonocnema kinseyi]